jgi:hypothetical protein
MKTTDCVWRKEIFKTIEPDTFVTLPELYKQECTTCIDIRIGCEICHVGEASTGDIYFTDDHFTKPFPIYELDFRTDFHYKYPEPEPIESPEDTAYDRMRLVWNVYQGKISPELIELIKKYKLEHGQRRECGKYISSGGISRSDDELYNQLFTKILRVYDSETDTEIPCVARLTDINLCDVCHHWLTILHPEFKTKFISLTTQEIGYAQWLDVHEKELVIENMDQIYDIIIGLMEVIVDVAADLTAAKQASKPVVETVADAVTELVPIAATVLEPIIE